MAKSVAFSSSPRTKPSPEDLDAFVHGGKDPAGVTSKDPDVQSSKSEAPVSAPGAPPAPEASAQEVDFAPKSAASSKVPMKRLTFDIPADLHRRIRINCVERGIDMAEDLRRILQEHYPPKP